MDYETILASLPDAVCVVDHTGQVVTINSALERLLGWRPSQLPGSTIAGCLSRFPDPAQALHWNVAIGQAIDQGQTTQLTLPAALSAAPGTSVSVTGTVAPWRGGGGEILGAILVLHPAPPDSTRNDIRERFAAMVAHELSSPLANVAAAADRLSENRELDAAHRLRLLQILRTETHRLRRLVGQFLTDPPPIESAAPPNTIVTLRPLLRRVLHIFELQDPQHRVAVQIPADIPFVWGDAGRIQEVLSNLVDHALRLAPAGSEVSVAAAEVGDSVVVTVSAPCEQPGGEPAPPTLQLAGATARALGGELSHSYDPATGIRFCFTLHSVDGARDGQE